MMNAPEVRTVQACEMKRREASPTAQQRPDVDDPDRPLSPRQGRRKLSVAVGLLGILSLGLGALWWVRTPQGMRFVVDIVAQRLRQSHGIQLDVGRIQADLMRARIDVDKLQIRGVDGQRLFTCDRLSAVLTPMQLLTGRLRLDHAEIVRPRSQLSIVGGHIAGLPQISGGPGQFIKISVDDLRIRDGQVRVRIEDKGLLELDGIDIHLQGQDRSRHAFGFAVGGGSYDQAPYHMKLSAFSGEGRQQGDDLLSIGRVDVERFVVGVDALRAELKGWVDFSRRGVTHLPAAAIELHLDAPLQRVKEIARIDLPLAGLVESDLWIESEASGKKARLRALTMVTGLRVDAFNLGDLTVIARATPSEIDLQHIAMAWGGSVIQGDAVITLDHRLSTRARAHGSDIGFGEILADMGLTGSWVNFWIHGQAEARGHLLPRFAFSGRGKGTVNELRVFDRSYLDAAERDQILGLDAIQVDTGIAFDSEAFRFNGAQLRDGLSELHGAATLYFDAQRGMRIELDPSQGDLASVSPIGQVDLGGHGMISGIIEGPYPDPHIQARADLNDFVLERYALGHTAGDIDYRRMLLAFRRVRAVKGESSYRADVSLNFSDGIDLVVEAALDHTQAEDLRGVIPRDGEVGGVMAFLRDLPLTGAISGRGVTRGNIAGGDTSKLTGSADLTLSAGTLYGQSFDRGETRGRLSLKTLFIDDLTLRRASGQLNIDGTIRRQDGALHAQLRATDMDLEKLELLANETAPVTGLADLEASFGGEITHMLARGEMIHRQLSVGQVQLGAGTLALRLDGRDLSFAGSTFDGAGQCTAQIEIARPFVYRAELSHDLSALGRWLPAQTLPQELSGRARLRAWAQGELSSLTRSSGEIALEDLTLRAGGLNLRAGDTVRARFANRVVDIERVELRHGTRDHLTVQGRLSRQQLSLEMDTEFDLDLLSAFTASISEAQGRLSATIGVSGPSSDPVLLGQGQLRDGRLVFAAFEHPIENLQGHLTWTRDTLLLDQVSASIDGAPVRGSGRLNLNGLRPQHLRLLASVEEPITLHIPRSVTTRSTGRLELSGSLDDLYLRGDIEVQSALYTTDWDADRMLPELKQRRLAPAHFDPEDEWVKLDLNLHADDNLVVRNNLLDVELKGDVRLTGTDQRPGMRGTLNLLHGSAQFRGNRYKIDQASIDLVDPYRIEPVFDVSAHTRTHGTHTYDINVRLQGPLDDIRIGLQSSPQLAEIDILSLVTLGFTREDMRDVGTATGTAALEVLSAYSGLDREVKRVLPLPVQEVRLSSIFSESQGTTVPSVVVGIELLEGLRLQVPYIEGARLRLQSSLLGATGGNTDQRVELDVRLNDRTSVRGVLDNDAERNFGDPGVDFNYRLEF